MGAMHCFVDMKIAGQPGRILKVKKTSMQEEPGSNTKPMMESVRTRMWVTDLLEAEPEVSEMLLKVCMRLVEHGVAPEGCWGTHGAWCQAGSSAANVEGHKARRQQEVTQE